MALATEDNDRTPPPPSFTGRLNLQDFAFKPTTDTMSAPIMRRSPRLSSTPQADSAPASPSPATPQPEQRDEKPANALLKRKASSVPAIKTESRAPASPAKNPQKRQKSGYAPPSTYAHLPFVPDSVAPNLLVFLVGLNPGIQTSRSGHAYAHPSNHFWRFLHSSGLTPRRCQPEEDRTMPRLYNLGLTNIVDRPSRNGAELSRAEMDAGVAALDVKARLWRPEAMCFVGKSIWESVWRVRHGGRAIGKAEFRYGWQDESENMGRGDPADDERVEGVDYSGEWRGARVFVATSTSGLAASVPLVEKERIWRELGSWAEKRRAERKVKAEEA